MTKVYFFRDNQYLSYDRGSDRVDDGYPRTIAGNWPGLAEAGFAQVDAAANWSNGKIFFFRGNQYVRYDIKGDKADSGYPLPIAGNWPGVAEAGFGNGVDAAVNWGNGKAYFFHGNQYLRYDIKTDRVDSGYPRPIAGQWSGLDTAGFTDRIDAVAMWGNGKAFFFHGDQYLRYDIAADKTDDGYPLPIAGNWPGVAEAGFRAGARAALDLLDESREIWVPNAEVIRGTANGPKFLPLPWRGVLHTTEGNTVEDAVASFRQTNFWSHFTIDFRTGRVVQHLPLNIGCRALSDHATAENAAHAIQIEIVGRAAESPTWAPEQLAFIRDVMRSVETLVPIARTSGRTFLDAAGVARTSGNRMSVAEWQAFSGWCGHQHVPGESHWDPGAIDVQALLAG